MDRLFDDFFRAPLLGGGGWSAGVWPSVEVSDSADEVRVTAELPGMNQKDVELTVQDGRLGGGYEESTVQGFDCGATGVSWRVVLERT